MAMFDQLQALGARITTQVLDLVGRTVIVKRRTGTRNDDNSTTWAYAAIATPKAHMQPVTEQRRNAVYGATSAVESEAIVAYAAGVQSGDVIVSGSLNMVVVRVINDDLAGTSTCGLRQPTAAEASTL